MGIIRLTLLTTVLIWLAMMYFGRDEGLPDRVIGREAPAPTQVIETAPEPVELEPEPAPEPEPEPEPEPPVAAAPAEPSPPEPVDRFEEAISEAMEEAEPEAEPEPEPAPTPAPDSVLYVTGATVNVRSGPSTVYDAITALPRGTAVVDQGNAGEGWRMIRLQSGETGYMSGDFLSPVAP
ncbi:SH3 domain-containing protein [Sinisalibacter lacisalsi]|uniref:SH3b domain-containing protein n=1 Tax=Sinisalibacter lacisalsi TaxID=1526570 RepID=A0ABQ1QFS4_9RHOB|nr:SH3 domain-containing protein [Sinisalibacter lacisalsi]GGD24106.1 hypothetical protein GCM10011358_05680 [Sinisalibacter lacisalsi]